MANFGANLELIPIYLENESKDELIRLMVINNQINASKFNYMNPMLVEKKWVVWFYADIKDWKSPVDLSEEELRFIKGFE